MASAASCAVSVAKERSERAWSTLPVTVVIDGPA
jgi:hypothetical protein